MKAVLLVGLLGTALAGAAIGVALWVRKKRGESPLADAEPLSTSSTIGPTGALSYAPRPPRKPKLRIGPKSKIPNQVIHGEQALTIHEDGHRSIEVGAPRAVATTSESGGGYGMRRPGDR